MSVSSTFMCARARDWWATGSGGCECGERDNNTRPRQATHQRRGPADDLALVVVLAAVARALELVLSLVPGDDAAQVRAHGVQAVVSQGAVVLHDQVRGVALWHSKPRVSRPGASGWRRGGRGGYPQRGSPRAGQQSRGAALRCNPVRAARTPPLRLAPRPRAACVGGPSSPGSAGGRPADESQATSWPSPRRRWRPWPPGRRRRRQR